MKRIAYLVLVALAIAGCRVPVITAIGHEIDRAIVAHLQYDGRKPFTEIAGDRNLSEGRVRRRVKQMTDEGIADPDRIFAFFVLV